MADTTTSWDEQGGGSTTSYEELLRLVNSYLNPASGEPPTTIPLPTYTDPTGQTAANMAPEDILALWGVHDAPLDTSVDNTVAMNSGQEQAINQQNLIRYLNSAIEASQQTTQGATRLGEGEPVGSSTTTTQTSSDLDNIPDIGALYRSMFPSLNNAAMMMGGMESALSRTGNSLSGVESGVNSMEQFFGSNPLGGLTSGLQGLGRTVDGLGSSISGAVDGLGGQLSGVVNGFGGELSGLLDGLNVPNMSGLEQGIGSLSSQLSNFTMPSFDLPNFSGLEQGIGGLSSQLSNFVMPSFNSPNFGGLEHEINGLSGQLSNFNIGDGLSDYFSNNPITGGMGMDEDAFSSVLSNYFDQNPLTASFNSSGIEQGIGQLSPLLSQVNQALANFSPGSFNVEGIDENQLAIALGSQFENGRLNSVMENLIRRNAGVDYGAITGTVERALANNGLTSDFLSGMGQGVAYEPFDSEGFMTNFNAQLGNQFTNFGTQFDTFKSDINTMLEPFLNGGVGGQAQPTVGDGGFTSADQIGEWIKDPAILKIIQDWAGVGNDYTDLGMMGDVTSSGELDALDGGYGGDYIFDSPALDQPSILDYAGGMQPYLQDEVVNRLYDANPYDTYRQSYLDGQGGWINRQYDEAEKDLTSSFGVMDNMGSPAYRAALIKLQGDKTAQLGKIGSEFDLEAARNYEGIKRGRISDLSSAISDEYGRTMASSQWQDQLQRNATDDSYRYLNQYNQSYMEPQAYQDTGLSMLNQGAGNMGQANGGAALAGYGAAANSYGAANQRKSEATADLYGSLAGSVNDLWGNKGNT